MRIVFLGFLLVLTLNLGCSRVPAPAASQNPPAVVVETEDVASNSEEVSETTPSFHFIDVRTQEEWESGHLEQAVLIPHGEIADRIGEVTSDKDAKIVLYCRSGGRAGRAKEALEGLGFTNVENAGGYEDIKDSYAEPTP